MPKSKEMIKHTHTHTHTQLFASLLNEFEQELLALKLPFYKLMVFFFFFFFTELLNTLINRKWPVKYMDTFRDLHKEYKVITTCFQSFD